jgi:hypothetical protein
MPSNAEALFNHVVGVDDPYAYLAGVPATLPPTFETEWLEFKSGNPDEKDLLKLWSEAVSGFANTEGGVLIWGIDCRKVGEVDTACGISLVAYPLVLKSRLTTNINQTTDPPVQGIQLREFLGSDGKGFLVCFVPESSNKPHRAEQSKNKPYMIRAGDSFVNANPSLLRSLFYPRIGPVLSIEIASTSNLESHDPIVDGKYEFKFQGRIRNTGSATARDVFLMVRSDPNGTVGIASHGWQLVKTFSGMNGLEFAKPLHPDMISICFEIKIKVSSQRSQEGVILPESAANVRFQIAAFANDMEKCLLHAEFSANDIIKKRAKKTDLGIPNPSW